MYYGCHSILKSDLSDSILKSDRSCPVLFKQLYSIHGMYRDHVVPLVYCLLKDMRRATYYQILELIKRRLADLDLTLEPTTVISDFEKALVPTICTQLRTSQHHGCLFHFSQAIWKRVQLLGLTTLYHSNHAVRDFIRKILALPFLPEAEISTAWHSLEEDNLLLQHPLLEDLTTYFSSTWIQGAYPLSCGVPIISGSVPTTTWKAGTPS